MKRPPNIVIECQVVGEFVDDAVADPNERTALEHQRKIGAVAEVVPPIMIAEIVHDAAGQTPQPRGGQPSAPQNGPGTSSGDQLSPDPKSCSPEDKAAPKSGN